MAIRAGARSRPRRSHAERTAETRARIIAAVVESIAELGFQRTTATEIARRAGVTWGAVQHHFGGKDGILLAVLEDSFARFAERVAAPDLASRPLDERISLFIDRAWLHFSSADYRSTFEILLNYPAPEDADDAPWQTQMLDAWDRVWTQLFGGAGGPRRRRSALQHYTISVLSGIATMAMLGGRERAARREALELAWLKQTLSQALSEDGDAAAG